MAEKQKLTELWIMTGFLCCFVVMIHLTSTPVSSLPLGSIRHTLFYAANKALSFVVPGFIFLSGLKLTYSYRNKPFVFTEFFCKRFTKILIPYIFWYIAYYFLFLHLGYMEPKTFWGHLFSFFMGDMVSPFYFITIVFQFYLLFGVILLLFQKFNHKWILISGVLLQTLYLEYMFLPYEDRFFVTYFIYFILGCFVSFRLEDCKKILQKYFLGIYVIFIALMAWHVIHAYGAAYSQMPYSHWRVLACLFSVSGIFAFLHLSQLLSLHLPSVLIWGVKWLDAASYGIFLCHSFLIYVCNEIWSQWGIVSVLRRFALNTMIVYPVAILGVIGFIIIKQYIYSKVLCRKL